MRLAWFLLALGLSSLALPRATSSPPEPPKEGPWVIPFAISPVGEIRPALKHRLLPEVRGSLPGNQIQAFYKCFFEQNQLFNNKETSDKHDKWLEADLKDLASDRELIDYARVPARQAAYAARLDTVDWQITNQVKLDGALLLLPDLQQMRMLTRVLRVRARGEIARGDFDAAIDTMRTMFALARSFNEHPTLIGALVGIAISHVALGTVEEFIQQPGAPNLFWPLANLPSPFIDLRKAGQGEKSFLPSEFQKLRSTTMLPDVELNALVKKLDEITAVELSVEKPSKWYAKWSSDKEAVAAARGRLKAAGHPAGELDKLSPLQILLMDDAFAFESYHDDFTKWTNYPYWQIPEDLGIKKGVRFGPLGDLLPAWQKVLFTRARLQQYIAILMNAEAVRAYAAANGGKLPATLAETKLPVPVDAYSGKPFGYEVKDGTALLKGFPPGEMSKNPYYNRQFAITIRK